MTKISVLYPNRKGARFDLLYYLDTHMPRSLELLGRHPGFKGVSVDRGATGAEPGTDAPYIIMCHFLFDSPEDIPNYTDNQPLIQFSDVLLSRTREADTSDLRTTT